MDQCIKARFEYQTSLWVAPPAPLCRTDCMWSLALLHSNCLLQKCLFCPPPLLHTLQKPPLCCLIAALALPSLSPLSLCLSLPVFFFAAESRSVSSALSRSLTCKIYDCSTVTKEERGSSSVSQSRYRFSNPIVLYPRILFSGVTVAEREKGRLKCSTGTRVYFHPALRSIRASVSLHLKEWADSPAPLGCLSSSHALRRRFSHMHIYIQYTYTEDMGILGFFFFWCYKQCSPQESNSLEEIFILF